ncbi:protocatechuate 3,4-dioxygenase [Corallococcus carmarthensis]|uniref:dioxygenase family protein n=1 Tax=Corallococcus carmarthensis TaxID=2316728 RepID=UPI00148BE357|nr:protocatechuate 3,4-dioxygenase [Corallococcus carmarthensis]NOK19704.1 protocatechuate 3,4-dioxygenase [Corallococcus carmarthensis]
MREEPRGAAEAPRPEVTAAFSRQKVLRVIGTGLVALPLLSLVRCDDDDDGSPDTDGGVTDAGTDAGATYAWATTGTAAITQATRDFDPFTESPGTACTLTCAMTEGPCYAPTRVAQDVTDGLAGVPVRFAFRLLDEACQPITDASVDIWHAMPTGVYAGESQNLAFCAGDAQAEVEPYQYFRGVQFTDEDGRVDFYSCYPGWYSSRTVHLHLTVRRGATADGGYSEQTGFLTTQLFFDNAISDDIYNHVATYARTAARDTNNTDDTVIAADAVSQYLFTQQVMEDGSLLCAKTLILRASVVEALCDAPGGSGGMDGGEGGPGPGGSPPPSDGGVVPPPGDGGAPPPPP